MEIKVNQFVKISDISSLKEVYAIQDETVEYWSGGNLTKVYKEYIEYCVNVDTCHIEGVGE